MDKKLFKAFKKKLDSEFDGEKFDFDSQRFDFDGKK